MTTLVPRPSVFKNQRAKTPNFDEVAASLRVLIYFARGNDVFTPEEREIVEESLQGVALPPGVELNHLLDADVDLDFELSQIASTESRERTYNAAYSLIHADGTSVEDREALLDHIRQGLHISQERAALMARMFEDARDWLVSSRVNPILDTTRRDAAVNDHALKLAIISALTGAVSAPVLSVFADMLVISIQIKLVRDIGQYWGQTLDREAGVAIISSILGATGIRIAVHSLVNIVPILGSAVGAASSFVTTWALGRVAHQYFARDGELTAHDLRAFYRQAKQDARAAYENSKDAVRAAAGKDSETALKAV